MLGSSGGYWCSILNLADSDPTESLACQVSSSNSVRFEARDRFMEIMKDGVNRVYRREPWVAANISEETRAALIKESGVKIVPDTKLSPLSKR